MCSLLFRVFRVFRGLPPMTVQEDQPRTTQTTRKPDPLTRRAQIRSDRHKRRGETVIPAVLCPLSSVPLCALRASAVDRATHPTAETRRTQRTPSKTQPDPSLRLCVDCLARKGNAKARRRQGPRKWQRTSSRCRLSPLAPWRLCALALLPSHWDLQSAAPRPCVSAFALTAPARKGNAKAQRRQDAKERGKGFIPLSSVV